MQGHRLLRAVAVLVLIVGLVYLAMALGGAVWLGNSGFGSGWGTGWTGWLVLPLAGSAVMAGLTLLVFGLMLFFLARIDDNLSAARLRPRVQRKAAAPELPAPGVVLTAAAPSAPVAPPPALAVASAPAPAAAGEAVVETPTVTVEEIPARSGEALSATPQFGASQEPVGQHLPRTVFTESAGGAVVPGGVLPSAEITEEPREAETPANAEPAPGETGGEAREAEAPVGDEPIAPAEPPARVVEAAPPDLILREPVQIEVEAGEPEIGLPVDTVSQPPTTPPVAAPLSGRADEVQLPRVDLGGGESDLESEDMAPSTWQPAPAAPPEPLATVARLPQVEITELGESASDESLSTLTEATGVPEPELSSGVPAESPSAQEAPPAPAAATDAPGLEALQAEVAVLRAQLAAIQAQLGQPFAPSSLSSRGQVGAISADDAEPTAGLPEEPPTQAASGDAAPASRLPGADEVARIAAEMNALKPKPNRPTPAAPASPTTSFRAPESKNVAGEDNLEIIMGVGPIYAKRLREVGITTYRQLAEAPYDVLERVARGNLERVIKEDWRGQARRLMERD